MARSDRRREPYFDEDPGDDLRAEPRARPQKGRKTRASARDDEPSPRRAPRARRAPGSLFGRLVYWALVLGLWGAIGVGGHLDAPDVCSSI